MKLMLLDGECQSPRPIHPECAGTVDVLAQVEDSSTLKVKDISVIPAVTRGCSCFSRKKPAPVKGRTARAYTETKQQDVK